jgi:hypothetical protein
MKNKLFFMMIVSTVLTIVMPVIGCGSTGATGSALITPQAGQPTVFEGVWTHQHQNAAHATYTFSNETVVYRRDNFESVSGKFTYNETTLEIEFANGDSINYQYEIAGGVLKLTGGGGPYYQGDFVKQ